MIRILVLMAALCGVVYLGMYSVHHDTNYVVIGFNEWVVRTSLTVFLACLVVVFIPAYGLCRALFAILRSPKSIQGWWSGRRYRNAHSILEDGLLALAEGHWKTAESQLVAAASKGADPVVSNVFAARAAHNQDAFDRRDEYLNRAAASQSGYSVAVGLSQAQMQVESGQKEQALASLVRLRTESPSHAEALRLLHDVYEELGDWEGLQALIPALKTYRTYDAAELEDIEAFCFYGQLLAESGDSKKLEALWGTIPPKHRRSTELVEVYVAAQLDVGAAAAAEEILRAAINHQWSEPLVELYGRVEADEGAQLKTAEAWLKTHPNSAALHLTLGRLCLRNRLWGKARSFLEESIAIRPSAEAHLAMSELLEQLDEPSSDVARRGLRLSLGYEADDKQRLLAVDDESQPEQGRAIEARV